MWRIMIAFVAFFPFELLLEAGTKTKKDDMYRSLETFAKGIYFIHEMYVDPTDVHSKKLIGSALAGVVESLDPHTVIMPPKAFKQLTNDTKGKFGGVGIVVSHKNNRLFIVSVIEGSPASRAKIQAKDEIISLDGVSLNKISFEKAIEMMRGDPGSKVKMKILRKGMGQKPLEFSLVREMIVVPSIRHEKLSDEIHYLRLATFQERASYEIEKILEEHSKNLKGLILDLRHNPGGLLDQAIRIADLFIKSGVIVSTVGRNPEMIEREFAHLQGTYTNFPLIVLVDQGSASASEIVAGALQDHGRALILGVKTFGKGSVQTLVSLPDGSGLKLTVARYYTPKGGSIQAKGITPDIIVHHQKSSNHSNKPNTEANLEGHLESVPMQQKEAKGGLSESMVKWPEEMQRDHQLIMAFTYLKGWGLFQSSQKDRALPTTK